MNQPVCICKDGKMPMVHLSSRESVAKIVTLDINVADSYNHMLRLTSKTSKCSQEQNSEGYKNNNNNNNKKGILLLKEEKEV